MREDPRGKQLANPESRSETKEKGRMMATPSIV